MNHKKLILRWLLLLGQMGIIGLMVACAAVGIGSANVAQGTLQLENGLVQVQDKDGDWQPIANESTFELVGALEKKEPWTVAGRALETNASTQIAEGLNVGDRVRVRGAMLEEDAWLAYSIEPADEQAGPDQTITLIGRVTSMDPWVVNGITLNVTSDTVIDGKVTVGTLVQVQILLLEDGTWEVVSISPLEDVVSTTGCATVIATVVSVNGDQVQFLGWPTPVTVGGNPQTDTDNNTNDNSTEDNGDENENDQENEVDINTLQPGQKVLAVVCVGENGQLVITSIVILADDDGAQTGNGEKVLVCHKPQKKGGHTISIASAAVPAHLAHGDKLGACP